MSVASVFPPFFTQVIPVLTATGVAGLLAELIKHPRRLD
jgi:hypothetical protein